MNVMQPPQNIEAEQGLIGAIFANNNVFESVNEYLKPEHFQDSLHGKIYAACAAVIGRGETANPVTLKRYFEGSDLDPTYLVKLSTSVVTVINGADYGRVIYDAFSRRELINVGQEIVREAMTPDIDSSAADIIQEAESKLFAVAETGISGGGLTGAADMSANAMRLIKAASKNHGRLLGMSTGLRDLDNSSGGLVYPDLVILAARPSMGKTSLARAISFHVAETSGPVAFFSLEMSREQQGISVLASLSGVPTSDLLAGIIGNKGPELETAQNRFQASKLFIDDRGALKVSQIRSAARRMKRRHGLSLIVIDYLQLISPEQQSGNRVTDLTQITSGLKALAKELGVPVLALSQLSRAVEQRDDKRPQLSDLRESGSIEQDADQVWFLYREEYYLSRKEPDPKYHNKYADWKADMSDCAGKATLDVAKRRMGPIGRCDLHFDGMLTTFRSV